MSAPLPPFRIGYGYDVHRLAAGRALWLGGVQLEHDQGLDGHSDADVLLHAICDALLGAANLRDIGYHFPPTDETWRGADSKLLLADSYALVQEKGWALANIDATVVAEAPKINPHIPAMQQAIAGCLNGTSPEQVSIKATTHEQMGTFGRQEGMAAMAVALLYKV